MDTARRIVGIALLALTPPAIVYWFVVHPFAAFWRRIGVRMTFAVLIAGMAASIAILYVNRGALLGRDLGTSWPLAVIGLVLYAIACGMEILVRKHLSFRTLAGVPEVAGESTLLLDQGIYARIRHPRYTSFLAAVFGFALFSNYVGMYVLALLCLPSILLLARFEERELQARLGERYTEYMRRVPGFIPRPG